MRVFRTLGFSLLVSAAAGVFRHGGAASSQEYELIELAGRVSVGGSPAAVGRGFGRGDELQVAGRAILRGKGHVLMLEGPAIVAIADSARPGLTLRSGSILGLRREPKARLRLTTPGADLDVGYAAFYVAPEKAGTYLCVCRREKEASAVPRHFGKLLSKRGLEPVRGYRDHTEPELERLAGLAR